MSVINRPIKKVLPLKSPINTTWTWNASLSAILGNHDCTNAWIYSNYIQLYCEFDPKDQGRNFIDFLLLSGGFHDCPWIANQILTRDFINSFIPDIQEFFIDCLATDNYIFVIVDENCFLGRSSQNKNKFFHELFIFGYDCETEMFDVADFTFDVGYTSSKVSFKDLVEAYRNVTPQDSVYGVELTFSHFNERASYNFDSVLVKQALQNFINSTILFDYPRIHANPKKKFAYGMGVYDCMIEHMDRLMDGTVKMDIRPFHTIYIHKVLMVLRLKFMIENGYLDSKHNFVEEYEQIQEHTLIIRNKYLKYYMNKDKNSALDIIKRINELKNKETEVIKYILCCI